MVDLSNPGVILQNDGSANFGLGTASRGTVEALWPGSVRNRLYDVQAGERLILPEIPCSFDAVWSSQAAYQTCVERALDDLAAAGHLDRDVRGRLLASALRAFREQ